MNIKGFHVRVCYKCRNKFLNTSDKRKERLVRKAQKNLLVCVMCGNKINLERLKTEELKLSKE